MATSYIGVPGSSPSSASDCIFLLVQTLEVSRCASVGVPTVCMGDTTESLAQGAGRHMGPYQRMGVLSVFLPLKQIRLIF